MVYSRCSVDAASTFARLKALLLQPFNSSTLQRSQRGANSSRLRPIKMHNHHIKGVPIKTNLLLCFALALAAVAHAAIVYPKAPEGGRQVVIENAKAILKSDPKSLGGFRIDELTIADPYRPYYVLPKDLAAGKLLPAAVRYGWQYPIMHGSNVVAMEELTANEKTGRCPTFNGLYDSNFTQEIITALRMAEQLPQIKKQDYEVRRLDCPPILFVALWLHAKTDDIIIPLGGHVRTMECHATLFRARNSQAIETRSEEETERAGDA